MAAFATPSDLEAGWRPLSPAEQTTATTLLDRASTRIRLECTRRGINADLDIDPEVTKMIACDMVKRAMIASGSEGIGQDNLTAGPFSQQRSYTNPMGNLYLTKQDKRDLGIGGQRAFSIDPLYVAPVEDA